MQKHTIDRRLSHSFSKFTNDFLYQNELFESFQRFAFSRENIEKQIELKQSFDTNKRKILVDHLLEQYSSASIELTEEISAQIQQLTLANTFTITTGHQLSLLTGPLFFIYKLLHAVKLSNELKKSYPTYNFVPIYWMASEDHDFEEIRKVKVFSKEFAWESSQNGAVGEFDTSTFKELIQEISQLFNREKNEITEALESYNGEKYSQAMFRFVHQLFKKYGLIILDANSPKLKREFIPYIEKDLFDFVGEKNVVNTSLQLEKLGYKNQITPRPVNFFYLSEQSRERIIVENQLYQTHTLGTKTANELKEELHAFPERFSPNVVMRPIYQEVILPNLVYIGGGAEIQYWTQLYGLFSAMNIPFPLLCIRNSIQIIDKNVQKKIAKLNLHFTDLFEDTELLKKKVVQTQTTNELDFAILDQDAKKLSDSLTHLGLKFDQGIQKSLEAEKVKLFNQLESIKQRILKFQKSQLDTEMKQVEDIKAKLFPNNGLQERADNFLTFCPDGNYSTFFSEIYSAIEPFGKDLVVIEL